MTTAIFTEVVEPVVEILGGGQAAAQLVYRTGLAESGYATRRQYGDGPARGYWQMEPATHDDIVNNFLAYRNELWNKVREASDVRLDTGFDAETLETNDRYACAMCRVHYMRVPASLPYYGALEAQAEYWKKHYNTPLGKGTVEHFIQAVGES